MLTGSVAAVVTMIACGVFFLLCHAAYIPNTLRYNMFKFMLKCEFLSAGLNIVRELLTRHGAEEWVIYLSHSLCTLVTFVLLLVFTLYFLKLFEVEYLGKLKLWYWIPIVFYIILAVAAVILPFMSFTIVGDTIFYSSLYGLVMQGVYTCFILYILLLLWVYRRALMPRIYQCVVITWVATAALIFWQYNQPILDNTSSCLILMLPLIALYSIAHHNSYNLETGTLDSSALAGYLHDMKAAGKAFEIISFSVQEFGDDIVDRRPLNDDFLAKYRQEFYNAYIFRFSSTRNVLVVGKKKGHKATFLQGLIEDFKIAYNPVGFNYKLVHVDSNKVEAEHSSHYAGLLDYVEDAAPLNQNYECVQDDYISYKRATYVLHALEDIARNCDLDDERVLAYCQPVLNRTTGTFDSAEALMRLKLPLYGLIYPDVFIPLAEQSGYIHALSKIILHKTCKEIGRLLAEGYCIHRISVNFSILEFRSEHFCEDIQTIISSNNVPFEKVAIELTESQNSYDFQMLRNRMQALRELDMKFYLDDFGTGYSNFNRILELPIDIIKFDKSLIALSNKGESSNYIVRKFAHIFSKLGYPILLEGVETEEDVQLSAGLNAEYLQGYKYSKPIPIEELHKFLTKKGTNKDEEASEVN